MAESTAKKTAESTPDEEKTNPGTPSPEATATPDTATAAKAGITEGEVKALRDDAGLNRLAGHEADIHQWSQSEAGQEYAKGEKDREQAAKEEEKSYSEQFNKDGLTEAEAKYKEAVEA